jgi:hypothetical protein
MLPRSWPGLLSIALSTAALHALDLTPTEGFRELEGFRIPVVRFSDGARRVVYQPPAGWRISGGGESLQVLPPDRVEAAVQFRTHRRPPLGENGSAEDFDAWSRSLLPPAATDIAALGAADGQFTLGAQPSRARRFSYAHSGRRFLASVAAVDLGDTERLSVVVIARESDFKGIHDEAIASLFSWQWDEA